MASIVVIDASESVRETIAILLGHEHRVTGSASLAEVAAFDDVALLVAGLPPAPHDAILVCREIARTPATVPVLFLNRPDDVDACELGHPTRRLAFLPKPFAAHALRVAVATALAPTPRGRARTGVIADSARFLAYPFVGRATATLLRQASDLSVPLVLIGEPGSGGIDIARALQPGGRGGRALQIVACRDLAPGDLRAMPPEAGGGVFLEGVHETPRAAQYDVLALLRGDLAADGSGTARVYASTPVGLEELAARADFLPELAYALGGFPVHLPPLRERVEDLDDLVPALSAAIAARAGLDAVTYSAAAMERLRRYLWFGNVAELESVLTRTLATRRPRVVAVDDLVFLPDQPAPAPASASAPAPSLRPADTAVSMAPRLEVLLGELAHELRNPMVTIKTFAQHLDSVLADPEVRARFSTLTTDAIGRMDALLERLLEFARFRAPVVTSVPLGALLDQALAEHGDELARKGVRVERNGARPGTVEADEAQLRFALRSLVAGLVDELVPHEPLHVTAPGAGTLELRAHAEPATAARLTAFVEGADPTGAETPTLPFALAAALLERNGGHLRVRSGGEGMTVITVALTPARAPVADSTS